MFSTLENTWDRSARRGWSAFASFAFQALALSLLLLVPLFSAQGPPRWEWLRPLVAPAGQQRPAEPPAARQHQRPETVSNVSGNHVIEPRVIPLTIAILNESVAPPAPDIDRNGVPGGIGPSRGNVINSMGPAVEGPPPAPKPASRPPRVSEWAAGNLVHRVAPVYPPLARVAGIQGTVVLRAIISRTGTIEGLSVESGHPMLVRAALEAVRQWRYRPYMLNGEPVEIESEVTVRFVIAR